MVSGWFYQDNRQLQDIRRSAEKSAGRTGKPQMVHKHKVGSLCNESCFGVLPGDWPPGQEKHREHMARLDG
jgi:hypothetical protein